MAKSKETFNKKEKEKRRLKQKQDKKQKMEERKANKKSGIVNEMIAYLDENGNLTDVPPDPRRRQIFELENIQVGVPKQEYTADKFRTGVVNFYNKAKGFGFINDLSTKERIFFHVKDILEPLEESDKVKFLVERGARGLNAVQVNKMS